MKYRNTETACVGFEGTDMLDGSGLESQPELEFGRLTGLSAGCPLVVGKMAARKGRGKALFICVADDPYNENPQEHILRFSVKGRKVKALGGGGPIEVSRTVDGCYEIPVVSNQGLLIEF